MNTAAGDLDREGDLEGEEDSEDFEMILIPEAAEDLVEDAEDSEHEAGLILVSLRFSTRSRSLVDFNL